MLTHLSLFSGVGGLDLAAEWAGFTTVGQCEWAEYPSKILAQHWPDVPRWGDIHELTKESFYDKTNLHTVTLISGGAPCQPFSLAGKRRGQEDDRYLWPEMLRVIREIIPTWVLFENVPGIVSLALDQVLTDLENEGYATQSYLIPACGVNAPHKRERLAVVAYAFDGSSAMRRHRELQDFDCNERRWDHHGGREETALSGEWGQYQSRSSGMADGLRTGVHETHSNPDSNGLQRRQLLQVLASSEAEREREREYASRVRRSSEELPGGDAVWEAWSHEPGIPRILDGVPNRMDRIKCLGNAVVPQQFFPFFYYMAQIERGESY